MSGFDNTTNRNRVEKIVEILGHLDKSAKSNRASQEEVAEMLAPVTQKLPKGMDVSIPGLDEAPAPVRTSKVPTHIQIREAAQNASLKDLTWAMAVFMTRIDEELN